MIALELVYLIDPDLPLRHEVARLICEYILVPFASVAGSVLLQASLLIFLLCWVAIGNVPRLRAVASVLTQ